MFRLASLKEVSLTVAFLFAAALVCSAQTVPDGYTVGTPWTGEPGVRERTSDIAQRESQRAQTKRPPLVHLHERIEYPELSDGTVEVREVRVM